MMSSHQIANVVDLHFKVKYFENKYIENIKLAIENISEFLSLLITEYQWRAVVAILQKP